MFGLTGITAPTVEKIFSVLVSGDFLSIEEVAKIAGTSKSSAVKVQHALLNGRYISIVGCSGRKFKYADNTVKRVAVFGRVAQSVKNENSIVFRVGYETFDNQNRIIEDSMLLELGAPLLDDIGKIWATIK